MNCWTVDEAAAEHYIAYHLEKEGRKYIFVFELNYTRRLYFTAPSKLLIEGIRILLYRTA